MGDEQPGQPWYTPGLKFSCTQCGNCCTGGAGVVWFTPEEARAMAAELQIDEPTFYKRFARRFGSRYSLTEKRSNKGLDCVLLDRESRPGKALCRVYRSRPQQCRSWPFWPENLSSREAWDEAKARVPCPGMGSGAFVPVEAIRIVVES